MPLAISAGVIEKENKAAMDALFKKIPGGPHFVDIGIFQGSNEEDGTPSAMVAAVHEFGSEQRNIPERSFMRSAVDGGRERINERLRLDLRAFVEGKGTKKTAFSRVGQFVRDLIQARIRASKSWAVPLKPATLAKKTVNGKIGDVPLIDTGRMLASVTYRIENEQPKK